MIHTASPFPNTAENKIDESEVIGPARDGTIRVLKAAANARVKKVIVTSSFGAVFGKT